MRKINIKGKTIEIKECKSSFSRAIGLMFRKTSMPLLFEFKKPTRQSIHSLFCWQFFAIWLKNGTVIDEKIVKPFSICVKPKKPFTQLIEIPLQNNNRNKKIFRR